MPADASPFYKTEVEDWGCDGHSHSYHTFQQLIGYDWNRVAVKRGVLSAAEWANWTNGGRSRGESPWSYSGGVMGAKIKVITAEEMDARLQSGQLENQEFEYYGSAEWSTPYHIAAGSFFTSSLHRLRSIADKVGYDNVRIVFFFDN